MLEHFPWAWKESRLVEVRRSAIELDHTPGRGWFRAGGRVSVRLAAPHACAEKVSIPGHERAGRELVVEELAVADRPLEFEFRGRCGYEATFEYAG